MNHFALMLVYGRRCESSVVGLGSSTCSSSLYVFIWDYLCWCRGEGGEGCIHNIVYHSHMTIDFVSLKSRDGAHRVFAEPGRDELLM